MVSSASVSHEKGSRISIRFPLIKEFLMKPVIKSKMASNIRKVLEDAKDEAHA